MEFRKEDIQVPVSYTHLDVYKRQVIYNTDDEIRQVLTELVNGTFSSDTELFRDLYNSLLNQNGGERADQYLSLIHICKRRYH